MDTSWVKRLIKDDGIRDCCLTEESAVHVLLGRSIETLDLLRALWSLLPSPHVPERSTTGYWIVQEPTARTKKPLRAVAMASRRVPVHRSVLPSRIPDKRGIKTEEFMEYKRIVGELSNYEDQRLMAFLRHGPCIYIPDFRGVPGADAERFPGASVLLTSKPPTDLAEFAGAAVVPSRLARSYAQQVGSSVYPRPLTFVVHYATRTSSLMQFHQALHTSPCETHRQAGWFVGPLVLSGSADLDIPIDDEEEEA